MWGAGADRWSDPLSGNLPRAMPPPSLRRPGPELSGATPLSRWRTSNRPMDVSIPSPHRAATDLTPSRASVPLVFFFLTKPRPRPRPRPPDDCTTSAALLWCAPCTTQHLRPLRQKLPRLFPQDTQTPSPTRRQPPMALNRCVQRSRNGIAKGIQHGPPQINRLLGMPGCSGNVTRFKVR